MHHVQKKTSYNIQFAIFMKDNVNSNSKLYYNESMNIFSTAYNESYGLLFEPFDCKRHERKPVKIKIGIYTLEIGRDNWEFAREGPIQWLWIDIYVQDVLLLPISKSCRKADKLYHFSEHEIAFLQYGAGHNGGKHPHTYMQARKNVDWKEALDTLVDICNNYNDWILQETEKLIYLLRTYKKDYFVDIATLLYMIRKYDKIVPDIIPVYRKFVDKYCFQAMSDLVKRIENAQSNDVIKKNNANYGDIIWTYIKDYYLLNKMF